MMGAGAKRALGLYRSCAPRQCVSQLWGATSCDRRSHRAQDNRAHPRACESTRAPRACPPCAAGVARQLTHLITLAQDPTSMSRPNIHVDGLSRPLKSPVRFRPLGASPDNPSIRRPEPMTATPGQIPTTTPTPDPSANTMAQLQFGLLFSLYSDSAAFRLLTQPRPGPVIRGKVPE